MRVSTDKFTHNKADKKFTAESSDLESGWIDGITLVSPRKTTANFFLKEVVRDLEGDVECWIFTCTTNPKVDRYQVVILND